jgi:hypothetical protein
VSGGSLILALRFSGDDRGLLVARASADADHPDVVVVRTEA